MSIIFTQEKKKQEKYLIIFFTLIILIILVLLGKKVYLSFSEFPMEEYKRSLPKIKFEILESEKLKKMELFKEI